MRRALVSTIGSMMSAIVLHRLGDGLLGAPPSLDPTDVADWVTDRGTVVAAMTALRLAAFALSVYLTAVSVLALLAEVTDASLMRSLLPRIAPAALRRGLGLGIVTALVAHAAPAASAGEVPVLVQVTAAPTSPTSTTVLVTPAPPTAPATPTAPVPPAPPTMVWTGTAPATGTSSTTMVGTGMVPTTSTSTVTSTSTTVPDAPPVPVATAVPAAPVDEWRVERGEHLWGIAAATVRARGGEGQAAVARYWRSLVEANRERLVVPANPDLVFPGQVFVLPPTAPAGMDQTLTR